jgi:hypothetical protein
MHCQYRDVNLKLKYGETNHSNGPLPARIYSLPHCEGRQAYALSVQRCQLEAEVWGNELQWDGCYLFVSSYSTSVSLVLVCMRIRFSSKTQKSRFGLSLRIFVCVFLFLYSLLIL